MRDWGTVSQRGKESCTWDCGLYLSWWDCCNACKNKLGTPEGVEVTA